MRYHYTLPGAAARLKKTPQEVLALIEAGVLPSYQKTPGLHYLPIVDVDRFSEENPPQAKKVKVHYPKVDVRGYVCIPAEARHVCGLYLGENVSCWRQGSHVVYRKGIYGDYESAVTDCVLEGVAGLLSAYGGFVHPGPVQNKPLTLAEIRKMAVENPDIQVYIPNLGFWIPWIRLLESKALQSV